ncbi:MAG: sensor histidine kinase [Bacteroidia bacterium]|nr:sensor histidine kinase [Bacteroidia bacterium]MBT8276064.1 sensor histidine kinase [Bacteroidia bacterium]NNF29956.1 sensor histidine kinase [Flavobacteriaceae bacterium]NNK53661.1 sensor histidine kinase [Flavobacteriaceae bacterium]NNM09318.1 sensor histidine kinase [Flavobacteriaceae bacterium]
MAKLIHFTLAILTFTQFYGQNIDSLKQIIQSSNDIEAKSSAYKAITNYYRRGDSVIFKRYLTEGIIYAHEINDTETELQLGFLNCKRLYSLGAYKKMITGIDSLIPMSKQLGLNELQGDLLNYKGNAYSNLSDYTNAAVTFIEYLAVAQALPDNTRPVAMANNNIGMAFLNMERFDQAILYLNRSLENQSEFDSDFKAHTYWNLGICYMEKEMYEEALDILKLGVAEAERKGDRYAAAGNQLCVGSVYLRQDSFEKGITAYREAYEMSTKSNLEPFKVIEALNGLIHAYNQLSRPLEAQQYIRLADSITDHHNLSDLRNREFLFQKGANLLQLGRPQEADAVFKRYSRAVDSLQNKENMQIIQTKETEFRTKEKERMLELQQADLDFQRLLNILLGVGTVFLVLIAFLVLRQQRLKIRHQKQEQELKEALQTVAMNKKLEDQRLRIAKELHDNIGSQLTYLASAAQNIGIGMKKVPSEVTENKLKDLSDFSQEAIADLRDTIWVMNRSLISWEDLAERIRYLAHKVSNTTGIQVNVKKEGDNDTALNPAQTMNIFRIIQEAVNNAVKHAQAKEICIRLEVGPPSFIEIQDDGKGYDSQNISSSSSGLRNMQSRADKLDASLDITSSEKGTKVRLEISDLQDAV